MIGHIFLAHSFQLFLSKFKTSVFHKSTKDLIRGFNGPKEKDAIKNNKHGTLYRIKIILTNLRLKMVYYTLKLKTLM